MGQSIKILATKWFDTVTTLQYIQGHEIRLVIVLGVLSSNLLAGNSSHILTTAKCTEVQRSQPLAGFLKVDFPFSKPSKGKYIYCLFSVSPYTFYNMH